MILRELKQYRLYLVIIALLAATAWPLLTWVDVRVSDEAGVRLSFPAVVGQWRGEQLRFCHDVECDSYGGEVTVTNDLCASCGALLMPMTPVEREQLPRDTQFVKFRYEKRSVGTLYVSVVLSGKERNSIHRPQRCLVGQGNQIVGDRVVPVSLSDSSSLDVMILNVHRHGFGGRDVATEYIYWFVGQGRSTPYHLVRMFWLAWDRLVHSVAHRWAYVAVQCDAAALNERNSKEVLAFVAAFHEEIAVSSP
jgi:hypothetical protein